jgi:hypothetical protein
MSAGVVQFPDGGKYPAARLTKLDQRVLALIARHLAAWHALDRECSALDEAGTPEAKAELDRLHAAVSKPEDELADIAAAIRSLRAGWTALMVWCAIRTGAETEPLDPNGPIAPARLARGGGGGVGCFVHLINLGPASAGLFLDP